MLTWFPEPYEDELLYSAVARFSDVMNYPGETTVLRELFGSKRIAPDLPTRLAWFINNLPSNSALTENKLIDDHTLFPYYAFPVDFSTIQDIRHKMVHNERYSAYMKLGLFSSTLSAPKTFRYCRCCVEKDRSDYGETFWHRVHQAAGVEVCPIHRVFLETTNIPFRIANMYSARFISAESYIGKVNLPSPRYLDRSNPAHASMLSVAEDAAWVLQNFRPNKDSITTRERYHAILLEKGYISYGGRTHVSKIVEELHTYGSGTHWNWVLPSLSTLPRFTIMRLIEDTHKTIPTLYHLILLQFLGFRANDFFQYVPNSDLFGQGPWPCLNPVCEYYLQMKIAECVVEVRKSGRSDQNIIGKFKCSCGYCYYRFGPDREGINLFRQVGILEYGDLWINKLRAMWMNRELTLKEIADRFKIGTNTVKKRATQLGFPSDRFSILLTKNESDINECLNIPKSRNHPQIEPYRKTFLLAREQYPYANRKALRKMFSKEYSYLSKYDSEWFDEHLPPSMQGKQVKLAAYRKRDDELIDKLPTIYKEMLTGLKRITVNTLLRNIGAKNSITSARQTIPKTYELATKLAESPYQYALRRLEMAVSEYRKLQVTPSKTNLIEKSGIDYYLYYGDYPDIWEAVDRAIAELST